MGYKKGIITPATAELAIKLANYMLESGTSSKQAAEHFELKQKWAFQLVTVKLPQADPALYQKIRPLIPVRNRPQAAALAHAITKEQAFHQAQTDNRYCVVNLNDEYNVVLQAAAERFCQLTGARIVESDQP